MLPRITRTICYAQAWNELNTGERGGSDEQPAILAFPTTAGPVQLDLSKYGLSGERPDAAGSPSSSPGGRPRSVGGGVTKNGRQQQQRSHTRGLSGWRRDRRDSTKSEISDADAAEATANGSEGKEGKLRTTSVSFSDSVAVQRLFPKRAAGEEDPPPLSAEVCAA